MPYQVVAELDPNTMQPKQSTGVVQSQSSQQPQRYQVQAEQNPGAANIDKFAAQSAIDQVDWLRAKGITAGITTGDILDRQKDAWSKAAQAQIEATQQEQRRRDELANKVAMYQVEQQGAKRMSDPQIDSAAGYSAAADTVMQLHYLHADALKNAPLYGTAAAGAAVDKPYNMTNESVRAYNAALEGSLTNIAKGVMGDSSVQAGEPSAQAGVRGLLLNDGDNEKMSGVKTAILLQKIMTNMGDKIRYLNGNNITATAMQDDYTRIYNQYKDLVTNYGSQSQLEHPAASPDEVFGSAQKRYIAQGVQPLQPVVKAGLSQPGQDTVNAVNARAAGQIPLAQAFPPGGQSPEQEGPWQLPQQASASPEAQQAVAAKQQQAQELQKAIPRAVGTSAQEAASGLGSTINWLGGLLPENWPQEAFDKPRPFDTSSQQYVGTGQ
jgi:dipeptidyl aminopeptidase/acylaminoacyl peptidase